MGSISVVILTANEEDNIKRSLRSVLWSDDIILIDNSSDRSVEIAQRLIPSKNLRVLHESNESNFANLRNIGLHLARHEWVLYLDADEVISPQLLQEINRKLYSTIARGFYMRRRDYFLGTWLRHGEVADLKLLKLAKKDGGKWRRAVHEVWDVSGFVDTLTNPLLHYPHPIVSEFVNRIDRWTTLDAETFKGQGQSSSWLKIIGYPSAKFIQNYILKAGFLDGMPGLIFAILMSFHSFLTRAKLFLLVR